MAATLWVPNGVTSHTTAAGLLHVPDIPHREIHLTVPLNASVRRAGLRVHRAALTRLDRVILDGIPCTSATRTLIDCAPLVDGEVLEHAVEWARRMGLTSLHALEGCLPRSRRGTAVLRDVLRHAQERPRESKLEVKLARLIRESRLPAPTVQLVIGEYRVDYAWEPWRVICECDGFAWHGNRLQWKRDRRRIATIEAAGWRIVHVTWEDVTQHREQTLLRLSEALDDARVARVA